MKKYELTTENPADAKSVLQAVAVNLQGYKI